MRYSRHELVSKPVCNLGFLPRKLFTSEQQFPFAPDLAELFIDLDKFLGALFYLFLERSI